MLHSAVLSWKAPAVIVIVNGVERYDTRKPFLVNVLKPGVFHFYFVIMLFTPWDNQPVDGFILEKNLGLVVSSSSVCRCLY